MKLISKILTAVAVVGIIAAIGISDTLYPTAKELLSSVVIVAMSVTNILIAAYLKELQINKK